MVDGVVIKMTGLMNLMLSFVFLSGVLSFWCLFACSSWVCAFLSVMVETLLGKALVAVVTYECTCLYVARCAWPFED